MVGLPFVGRTTSPPSPRIAPPDEVLLVELLPPGNLLPAWKHLVPDGASCSSPFHRRLLPPLVLNVSCLPPCLQLPLPCSSPLSRRLLPYLLLCFPLPCRLCSSPPEGPPASAAPPRLGSSTCRRCSSKPGKLRRPHCSSNLLPAAALHCSSLQVCKVLTADGLILLQGQSPPLLLG